MAEVMAAAKDGDGREARVDASEQSRKVQQKPPVPVLYLTLQEKCAARQQQQQQRLRWPY